MIKFKVVSRTKTEVDEKPDRWDIILQEVKVERVEGESEATGVSGRNTVVGPTTPGRIAIAQRPNIDVGVDVPLSFSFPTSDPARGKAFAKGGKWKLVPDDEPASATKKK